MVQLSEVKHKLGIPVIWHYTWQWCLQPWLTCGFMKTLHRVWLLGVRLDQFTQMSARQGSLHAGFSGTVHKLYPTILQTQGGLWVDEVDLFVSYTKVVNYSIWHHLTHGVLIRRNTTKTDHNLNECQCLVKACFVKHTLVFLLPYRDYKCEFLTFRLCWSTHF